MKCVPCWNIVLHWYTATSWMGWYSSWQTGHSLNKTFCASGTIPLPPPLPFQPVRGRGGWQSAGGWWPRVERGEQALGLVGTKLQQPCFHKAGTSQKHGTTSISPGTLQQSLQLRGSPTPPASAWGQEVSCLKGMAWVLSVFCPYSAAVYYGIHNTTMRGITSCFSSCLLPI